MAVLWHARRLAGATKQQLEENLGAAGLSRLVDGPADRKALDRTRA